MYGGAARNSPRKISLAGFEETRDDDVGCKTLSPGLLVMERLEMGSPSMFKDGSESLLGCLEPGGLGLEVEEEEETRNFVKEFGWESVDVVLGGSMVFCGIGRISESSPLINLLTSKLTWL
jgi:hypothetical protein